VGDPLDRPAAGAEVDGDGFGSTVGDELVLDGAVWLDAATGRLVDAR